MNVMLQLKLLIVVILLLGIVGGLLLFYTPIGVNLDESKQVVIEKGTSVQAVADNLMERGLVFSSFVFRTYLWLRGLEDEVKAGTYVLSGKVSIHDLSKLITDPSAGSSDLVLTIPEGFNIAEIDELLNNASFLLPGELLGRYSAELEGKLFPDTYRIARGSSVEVIVDKLQKNFEAKIGSLEQTIDQDLLIVASMLEKEVRTEGDMRKVAGIMYKRMDNDWPLEIDATVAYGACHRKFVQGQFCDVSKISIVDNIPIDSAYNTYRRRGLPGGAISNPGLKAIRASLDPEETEFWYYLSKPDGTTVFSRTLDEHNNARRLYLN